MADQAVAAGWQVVEQYLAPGGEPLAGAPGAVVHTLGPNVIERVASTETPPDLIAVVAQRPSTLPTGDGFVVVADRLADPGNAGTIVRGAEAAGAAAVVLTPGSVDAYNPKVVRATVGSLFRVPVVEAALDEVAAAGYAIVATSSHHGEVYTDADLRGQVAVVLGNEAHGLPDDVRADHWVRIPQHGEIESLNVAMAATLLMFEVARQRRGQ